MSIITAFIIGGLISLIFNIRFDWDKTNKILFLWYDWGRTRKYIKLYDENKDI